MGKNNGVVFYYDSNNNLRVFDSNESNTNKYMNKFIRNNKNKKFNTNLKPSKYDDFMEEYNNVMGFDYDNDIHSRTPKSVKEQVAKTGLENYLKKNKLTRDEMLNLKNDLNTNNRKIESKLIEKIYENIKNKKRS